VFRDIDQDGDTDEGELFTLNDAGIEALSLNYTNESFIDEFGNEHRQVGSYTHTNGETRTMTDVWFDRNLSDTIEETIAVTAEIAALPDAQGSGLSRSLHQAMARDESGELQQLVTAFVNAGSRDERLAPIIYVWTNQEGEYSPHFQSPIDTRKIGALEAFYGYAVDNPRGSGQQYARLCRMMAPAFEQTAAQLEPAVRLVKVNTEEAQQLGARFGIRSIPTLMLMREGKEVARQAGAMDLGSIVRWARQYLAG
jgi:hypothetical protein